MIVEECILHMKEVGGACSFCALNAALLFNLGATVGAFTDATAILSLLLCPGTPSKVLAGPCLVCSPFADILFLIAGGGGAWPSLNDAARLIRGAMIGAAVDATAMVLERLCPGTFAKVCARRSLDTGARGIFRVFSTGWPARRAAARVVRGTISGLS